MPSYSRNSAMAKATGLIFSLFDVVSAHEEPLAILLYMQCTYQCPRLCPIHICSQQKVLICGWGVWLPFTMEIVSNFYSGYFDCKCSF